MVQTVSPGGCVKLWNGLPCNLLACWPFFRRLLQLAGCLKKTWRAVCDEVKAGSPRAGPASWARGGGLITHRLTHHSWAGKDGEQAVGSGFLGTRLARVRGHCCSPDLGIFLSQSSAHIHPALAGSLQLTWLTQNEGKRGCQMSTLAWVSRLLGTKENRNGFESSWWQIRSNLKGRDRCHMSKQVTFLLEKMEFLRNQYVPRKGRPAGGNRRRLWGIQGLCTGAAPRALPPGPVGVTLATHKQMPSSRAVGREGVDGSAHFQSHSWEKESPILWQLISVLKQILPLKLIHSRWRSPPWILTQIFIVWLILTALFISFSADWRSQIGRGLKGCWQQDGTVGGSRACLCHDRHPEIVPGWPVTK